MSRSYRKNPVRGWTTARTEKDDKRIYNRALRRINRRLLQGGQDEALFQDKREVMDIWSMNKDGKMRFDPNKHPKLMRK